MKKGIILAVLFMSVVLIAGCTSNGSTTAEENGISTSPTNEENSNPSTINEISFKVELTTDGSSSISEFKARNLNTNTPDFRITSNQGSDLIVLGSESKGWQTFLNLQDEWEWTTIIGGMYSNSTDWNLIWDDYYTNYFLQFYELAKQASGSEITQGTEENGVRVYDINKNPNLDDSVFANPMD